MAAAVALIPAAASAHATFEGAARAPADSDADLVLNIPEELDDIRTTKVTVEVPPGFLVRSCAPAGSFTCKQKAASGGRGILVWERGGGDDVVESFSFTVHTPKDAGTYAFEAHQSYADGSTVHWDGDSDSEYPAPVLEVVAASANMASANTGEPTKKCPAGGPGLFHKCPCQPVPAGGPSPSPAHACACPTPAQGGSPDHVCPKA